MSNVFVIEFLMVIHSKAAGSQHRLDSKHTNVDADDGECGTGEFFEFEIRADGQQGQLRFYFMVFCETYLTISFFLILTTLKNLP